MNFQFFEPVSFLWGHLLLAVVLVCVAAAALFWLAAAASCVAGLAQRLRMMGPTAQANDAPALPASFA